MAVIVVDGDILPYEVGFAMDDGADWHQVRSAIQEKFSNILERGSHFIGEEIEDVQVYLSDPEFTFRKHIASILPYKGNRKHYKPTHWDGIRAFLRDQYNATSLPLLEGDDAVLIYKNIEEKKGNKVLVASSDKDLRQVPVKMYRWATRNRDEAFYEVDHAIIGHRHFWTQMLTGDRTDNIMGLFGVGPTTACVKHLHSMMDPADMAKHVYHEYERRFGSYGRQFFEETFKLLRIIDSEDYFEVNDPYEWMDLLLATVWNHIDEEDTSNHAGMAITRDS